MNWMRMGLLLAIGCTVSISMAAKDSPGRVIFREDFESGNFSQWDADSDLNDSQHLKMTSDPENVFHGRHAVEMTIRPDQPKGAKLNKWFMPGYDRIYARFYGKFAQDYDQGNHMHWAHVMGNRVDDKWSSFGKAGLKPGGTDFFSIGIEPWRDWGKYPPPGRMMFYTYHMDMPLDTKTDKYYGQMYLSDPPVLIKGGQWYCYEVMIKANQPGQADGEQTLWIDGQQVIHTEGLRFRTSDDVRINGFWLSLYVHDTPQENTCWYDELVISQDPIGPLTGNADDKVEGH